MGGGGLTVAAGSFLHAFYMEILLPQWSSANHCLITERWISSPGLMNSGVEICAAVMVPDCSSSVVEEGKQPDPAAFVQMSEKDRPEESAAAGLRHLRWAASISTDRD